MDVWKIDPKKLEDAEVYSLLKLIGASRHSPQTYHLKSLVGNHLQPIARFPTSVYKEREADTDHAFVTGNEATNVRFYFENDTPLIDYWKLKAVQDAFFQVKHHVLGILTENYRAELSEHGAVIWDGSLLLVHPCAITRRRSREIEEL